MSKFRIALALVVVALLAVWPATANASGGWPWPLSGKIVLAYGRTYTGARGTTCTHGGIDIGSEAGTPVRACASGQIAFAGRVPAGEGAQTFAVTVLTADGLRVTYLPLRSISVRRGENVSGGETLGVLAAAGDASCAQTHLHLGVRRGGTQLDPAAFLGAVEPAATSAATPSATKGVGSGLPVRVHTPSAAYGATHAAQGVSAHAGASSVTLRAQVSLEQAVRIAAGSSSSALARIPALTRVREVESSPVLDVSRMMSDLRSGRGWLAALLARLALVAVGGACVLPVLRSVRGARAARGVQVALARRPVR
jgi:hypothetical protein